MHVRHGCQANEVRRDPPDSAGVAWGSRVAGAQRMGAALGSGILSGRRRRRRGCLWLRLHMGLPEMRRESLAKTCSEWKNGWKQVSFHDDRRHPEPLLGALAGGCVTNRPDGSIFRVPHRCDLKPPQSLACHTTLQRRVGLPPQPDSRPRSTVASPARRNVRYSLASRKVIRARLEPRSYLL